MDLDALKSEIKVNVYHMTPDRKVPLHNHPDHDELFYCVKGFGLGMLDDEEIKMEVGDTFRVPAGMPHSVRSEEEMFVCSFLIPAIKP